MVYKSIGLVESQTQSGEAVEPSNKKIVPQETQMLRMGLFHGTIFGRRGSKQKKQHLFMSTIFLPYFQVEADNSEPGEFWTWEQKGRRQPSFGPWDFYKTKPLVFMAKITKKSDNFTVTLDSCCIQKCLSNICLTLELIGSTPNKKIAQL